MEDMMTYKEQLEKAKANWDYRSGSLSDNVKWLIEQAEQIPTLESYMNTLAKYGDDTRNRLLEVKSENKKLREALEFYADKMNYINFHDQYLDKLPSEIDFDEGKKARQALENK